MSTSKNLSVSQALFGELDDGTRRRFGLPSPDGKGRDEEPAPRLAEAGLTPDEVSLRDLDGSDLVAIGKNTVKKIGEDRVTAIAAGVTFFGLLSLFPALTALVSIYGLVADPATITQHLDMLSGLLPSGALDIIRNQVEAIVSAPGAALSVAGLVGLLAAFYSANGGMKALLSALNVAFFQSETRGFLRLNVVAMCFTLAGLVLIVLMLMTVAVIPMILSWLPLPVDADNAKLLALLRWPLVFAVLILALAAVYRWGPSSPNTRWRWVSPGAVFAGFALVVASMLFSWYAANFANYNETYGSLGAVIGLMMWLWLGATIILIGAEINSAIEMRMRKLAGAPPPGEGEET